MWLLPMLLTTFLILWNAFAGISTLVFHLHRDVPSIAFRAPYVALAQAAVLVLLVNFYLLRTLTVEMPCFVMLWTNSLAIPLFLFLFFIRYIWLAKEYWKSTLQMLIHDREYEEKRRFLDSNQAQAKASNLWEFSIPKIPPEEAEITAAKKVAVCEFFGLVFIRTALVFFFIIQVITLIVEMTVSDDFSLGVTSCTPAAVEYVPLFIWSAATLILVPFAVYVVFGVKENYGICTELDITTVIIIATFIVISASAFLYRKIELVHELHDTIRPRFIIIGAFVLLFVISIAYPAFTAWLSEISRLKHMDIESQKCSEKKSSDTKEKGGLSEFDSSLRNPEIMKKFRRFSIKDFSTENVIFYEKWMRAKEVAESGGYWQVLYIKIYNDFLKSDAPMELNIAAPLLKEVHTEFAKKDELDNPMFDEDVLDKVAVEVLKLMYENTYTRFIRGKQTEQR
jgi:hypothetical protein